MNELSFRPEPTDESQVPYEPSRRGRATVRLPSTAIALAGLVAGTIDIGAACLINHANPVVILLVIASGVLGKAAFHAGVWAAALGLLLQGVMSLLIAAIFVVVSRRWSWTRRNWIAAGLAYGGCIFAVMNFVVVPLSAVPIPLHFTATGFAENLAAMLLFGLIVAMLTRPGAR